MDRGSYTGWNVTTELELARQHPSASGAERLVHCPGSWALEKQQPPEPDNAFTEAGNRMHRAWQTGDDSELVGDEPERMRKTREIEADLVERWIASVPPISSLNLQSDCRERRIWGHGRSFSGQPDRAIVRGEYGLILDLKSGWANVEPPIANWQLRALAVLLNRETEGVVSTIDVALVQPLKRQMPMCRYEPLDLEQAGDDLAVALIRSDDESVRIPGPWCSFCRARTICPEALSVVQSLALPGRWDILPPERKLDLWRKSKVAAKICTDIQKAVKADLACDPESIPGLRKKADTEQREISDVLAFYQHLIDSGIDKDRLDPLFLTACGINVGDATKIVSDLRCLSEKNASVLITKDTPGVTMKPRSGEVEETK